MTKPDMRIHQYYTHTHTLVHTHLYIHGHIILHALHTHTVIHTQPHSCIVVCFFNWSISLALRGTADL